jgi:hypothetical protein
MFRSPRKDVISQTELRKGAEFAIGGSSAVDLVGELYMLALERLVADGALIEPGPLGFHTFRGVRL